MSKSLTKHKEKLQEIIVKNLGDNFALYKTEETSKYIFGFWKHINYEYDDDRGNLIGSGPAVFIKETKEYKMLGSGDLVYEDYFDEIREEDDPDWDGWYTIDEIIVGTLRRKYSNEDDIITVIYHTIKDLEKTPQFSLEPTNWKKPEVDFVLTTDYEPIYNAVITFLKDCKVEYMENNDGITFKRELDIYKDL